MAHLIEWHCQSFHFLFLSYWQASVVALCESQTLHLALFFWINFMLLFPGFFSSVFGLGDHVSELFRYTEACIGGYQISYIPWSKQASIPYKLANIPIINFPKFSISLEVTKILNQVSHIPWSKMDSILYPWKWNGKYPVSLKPLYKPIYWSPVYDNCFIGATAPTPRWTT